MRQIQDAHRGSALADDERARLRELVDLLGLRAACERIGASRQSIHAALAGMPIYRVTRAAIRAVLIAPPIIR
jgi:hypothetical protein